MTAAVSGRLHRHITPDEQRIYDHLLHWIDKETPEEMLERFRSLFIEGTNYPDPEIMASLERVVGSRAAADEFRFVLNRCCHILVNRWQANHSHQMAIPKLMELFEVSSTSAYVSTRTRARSFKRQRDLIRQFTETEQYHTLHRLAEVLSQAAEATPTNRTLGTLIRRYPYLYEHCLLSEDATSEHQSTVRQIQVEMQRKFEIDLSQYVTYQVRRAQSEAVSRVLTTPSPRIIQPVANPTLLSEQEFKQAIKHYVGRVDGSRSYKDIAHSFLVQSTHNQTFRNFKDDLYDYITVSVGGDYGRRKFNKQLSTHLDSILPDSNNQKLNDFLMVRTCSQLFNFLVVESFQSPNHFVFVDLLTNLGPILTTGILLKIVLLCRKVKPVLERRFSILFSHYEEHTRDMVQWLVMAMENLHLALSANFGSIDLSFIR
ncbi:MULTISPECIES: hypothetical protein [unclassified Leptolyngbya]|uniref:hypothetical protein n=1 Tax=unclassified Leptolyngbya TaxID=2650499 RepID=UPI0016848D1E|nr:hypothetical protein [Leptolyngbya sp. FACHB-8]MBD2158769.1 hypothetical protein [Leptolyngbya sp. FACHB-16]